MIDKMIRLLFVAALLVAGLLAAARAEAAVQGNELSTGNALREAVLARDGVARFEFAARSEVWGDGRTWSFVREGEEARDRRWSHCDGCTNGPVRVTVLVADGVVTRIDSQVGGRWKEGGRDLGQASPSAAADYLLELAESGGASLDADSREDALQAAVAGANVDVWPRLLRIARDRAQADDVRKAALFWTAHEAGERAAADIEEIAVASDEETDVQEAAVFALTQLPEDRGTEALLRLARENRNPRIVQTVYFWLGQSEDPRAVSLFEEVLLD